LTAKVFMAAFRSVTTRPYGADAPESRVSRTGLSLFADTFVGAALL
jgi:hypothetical protein